MQHERYYISLYDTYHAGFRENGPNLKYLTTAWKRLPVAPSLPHTRPTSYPRRASAPPRDLLRRDLCSRREAAERLEPSSADGGR